MARAYAIEEPYPLWGRLQPYAQTLDFPGTNALAHYEKSVNYNLKKFYNIWLLLNNVWFINEAYDESKLVIS